MVCEWAGDPNHFDPAIEACGDTASHVIITADTFLPGPPPITVPGEEFYVCAPHLGAFTHWVALEHINPNPIQVTITRMRTP